MSCLASRGDAVVDLVSQQGGLAVDADRRVLLRVLLDGVELRRDVEHLVARGQRVVEGQHPLVADLVVGGGVVGDGSLEADLEAGAGAGAPLADRLLVGDGQGEHVLGIIPRGRVLLLGHRLAGVQVHHLQGLLVRFQIGVVGVGEAHGLDLVGEVGRQLRLGVELVFDLLAGLDDFAVHALLVAALARLGHDVLLDRRDVAADRGSLVGSVWLFTVSEPPLVRFLPFGAVQKVSSSPACLPKSLRTWAAPLPSAKLILPGMRSVTCFGFFSFFNPLR